MPQEHPSDRLQRVQFTNTNWSEVIAAGDAGSPTSKTALESLCRAYWYPLYAYVRRKGYATPDAEDMTQGFFSQLLERNYLTAADRNRGRFRSFLLGAFEHFLAREWTRAHAQKRGGGQPVVSFDGMPAEQRYALEPVDNLTPQMIYERRWALTILERARQGLRAEYEARGQASQIVPLEPLLSEPSSEKSYAEIATGLGMTEGALKVAVHRLRKRYGELVRLEIAQTLATTDELDAELEHLLAILRS